MEITTINKIIIAIVLLAFWGYGSGTLTANPSFTIYDRSIRIWEKEENPRRQKASED